VDGGIVAEQRYVEREYFEHFANNGWDVARAVRALWGGESFVLVRIDS